MTRPGIVLCSRVHSRRLPNKPLIEFCGKPAIRILCERLLEGHYPVCLATPTDSEDDILHEVTADLPLLCFRGHRDNVLARFYWAAVEHDFDPVIRVTHDDLFVDTEMMAIMVFNHIGLKADYTYVSECLRGADCEIVSRDLVKRGLKLHGDKESEFLSYTFRRPELNPKIVEYSPILSKQSTARLVMDWSEDVKALSLIFGLYGPNVKNELLCDVVKLIPAITEINKFPKVSIYTCAYNAGDTIVRAIKSVLSQTYSDYEYIVLDDGSTDETSSMILNYACHPKIKVMRNRNNKGLASSCNIALRDARGKYILRLDADDELLPSALEQLVDMMDRSSTTAAIYPAYYFNHSITQNTEHPMGGAMIRRAVYEEVKFCDGLRHWEGKEFYQRLSSRFIATQFDVPTWVYHERDDSLSKSDIDNRAMLHDFITRTTLSGESKQCSSS